MGMCPWGLYKYLCTKLELKFLHFPFPIFFFFKKLFMGTIASEKSFLNRLIKTPGKSLFDLT